MNYAEVKKEVGLAIRDLRIKRGLSQAALAKSAGTNRYFPTRVETGTRNLTLQRMSRLAEALGVGEGEFFKIGQQKARAHPWAEELKALL